MISLRTAVSWATLTACFLGVSTVRASSGNDLVVTEVSVSPEHPDDESDAFVVCRFKNDGTTTLYHILLVVGIDGVEDRVEIYKLSAGSDGVYTRRMGVFSAGEHTVWCKINPEQEIPETSYGNNEERIVKSWCCVPPPPPNEAPHCDPSDGDLEVGIGRTGSWAVDCADAEGLDVLVWSADGVEVARVDVEGLTSVSRALAWAFDAPGMHRMTVKAVDTAGLESPEVGWDVQILGVAEGSLTWGSGPVPGAILRFEREDDREAFAETDEDGAFVVPLADGAWKLQGIEHPHFELGDPVAFTVEGGTALPLAVKARPTFAIAEFGTRGVRVDAYVVRFFEPPAGDDVSSPQSEAGFCEVDLAAETLVCTDLIDDAILPFPSAAVPPGRYLVRASAHDMKDWVPAPRGGEIEMKEGVISRIAPAFTPVYGVLSLRVSAPGVRWIELQVSDAEGPIGACELDLEAVIAECDGLVPAEPGELGARPRDGFPFRFPEGRYVVTLTSEETLPFETAASVKSGRLSKLSAALTPRFGALHFPAARPAPEEYEVVILHGEEEVAACVVVPGEGIVECDGGAPWVDPFPSIRLEDGKYVLVASAEGMKDVSKPFTIKGGRVSKVPLAFRSATGILELRVAPKWLSDYVVHLASDSRSAVCERSGSEWTCEGDAAAGGKPGEIRILEDRYDVEVEAEGFQLFEKKSVAVAGGRKTRIPVTLVPESPVLQVVPRNPRLGSYSFMVEDPEGIEVGRCDVALVGEPDAECEGVEILAPGVFKLESGTYAIRFATPGAAETTLAVTLADGRISTLAPAFKANVVEVTVVDAQRRIRSGSVLLVDDAGSEVMAQDVGRSGKVTFAFVPEWVVRAVYLDPAGFFAGDAPVEVAAGKRVVVRVEVSG